MNSTDVLDLLRESEALLTGHFELRSGLHSDQFFQCANVLRYPLRAASLADALAACLVREPGAADGLAGVIAPALGGIVVGHEVARALATLTGNSGLRSIFAEKQDGALALRRFAIAAGERYVVAEDVVTRGGRVQETVDIVRQQGGVVSAIAVLVDRSGGKAQFDVPLVTLVRMEPVTWTPADCPLCREGAPLVHPGS